ncbi:BT_3928 family protein, partial [Prevotella sp.]|uniref:BT_3928 family protein n=1 Tax=Prevotella sp. TaxID=59823 RepID=UPI0025DC5373
MAKFRIFIVNLCRMALALTFILSGYVKAIDPLGTQYKLNDYAAAMHLSEYIPDWLTLTGAIALAMTEFALGIFMLFAIRRHLVSRLMTAMMVMMTLITVWIFIANPVKDCGCFGDAIKLTNGETLLKNIVLLAAAIVTAMRPLDMARLISKSNQWIVTNYTLVYIVCTSLYCLYALPTFDFRPYHIGADIKKGMEIPEGAEQPEFETTFILKKNGQTREFTLDNYPDSTWEFVDSKTVQTRQGYEPPIHDFSLTDTKTGEDITDNVLSHKGYTFLLISRSLAYADDSNFGDIDQIYEYASEHNIPFYCVTASTDSDINRWRDLTGAEYPFCTADETTLKTIIRSNPGLLLLKDATIIGKWSHNQLPDPDELTASPDKLPIGQQP